MPDNVFAQHDGSDTGPRRQSPFTTGSLVLLGYTIPSLYLFQDVVTRLNRAIPGPFPDGDAFFNVWHLWVAKRAIDAWQDPAYTDRIFALVPGHVQIFVEFLYSDWMGWLLQLLVEPLAAYNLLIVSSFILSGCTVYLLAREFVETRLACFAAGWLFSFSWYHFYRAGGHLGLCTIQWLPFCAWRLIALVRRPSLRNAVLAGIGVALVPLSDVYYVAFFLFPFGLVLGVWVLLFQFRWLTPRNLALTTLALLIALAAAGPWLRSYVFMDAEMATANQALVDATLGRGGADLASYVLPPANSRYWGAWTTPTYAKMLAIEKETYLGVVALLLGALALFNRTHRRSDVAFWFLVAAFGVLISLGPTIVMAGDVLAESSIYNRLFGFPPFSQFRMPTRTAVLALLGVSLLAAFGAQALLTRRRVVGVIAVPALLIGALFDTSAWGIPFPSQPVTVPALYRALAQDRGDSILLNLPLAAQERFQFYQTIHQKRIPFAFVSRLTPSMRKSVDDVPSLGLFWVTNGSEQQLVGFASDWQVVGAAGLHPPAPEFKGQLQNRDINYVVLHHTMDAQSQAWMQAFLLSSLGTPFYDSADEGLTAWCLVAVCPAITR